MPLLIALCIKSNVVNMSALLINYSSVRWLKSYLRIYNSSSVNFTLDTLSILSTEVKGKIKFFDFNLFLCNLIVDFTIFMNIPIC